MESADPEQPAVSIIRPTRVASLLAAELREQIVRGDIPDGASLPPERVLSEQSGLGRSSVREALRTLEAEGLITVRTGRSGGIIVHHPGAATLSRSIGMLVKSNKMTTHGLVEFRELLEPSCAGLAAARRSEHDLVELEHCNEQMATCIDLIEHGESRRNELIEINARWHIAVATSTHNPLVAQMISSTESTLRSSVLTEFNRSYLGDDSIWTITLAAHRTVTDVIAKNDIDAPIRRMGRHVHSYADLVTKRTEKIPDPVLFYFAMAERQRSTKVNIHPTRSEVARAQPERHIPI